MRIGAPRPGRPWTMGATPDEEGVNVAVFSAHAEKIELCLFDAEGRNELRRIALPERTDHIFHAHVPGLREGQVYGFRAHGLWAPERGHRFNPAKLLLDPYARGLVGEVRWEGPNLVDPADPFAFDPRDSAPFVSKAVVAPPLPPFKGTRPSVPWDETVLYEAHVRGMTRLNPALPERERGTFKGLAHPKVIEHLVKLGVSTVELMPIMDFVDELKLVRRGLVNYWGYNTLAFLVPDRRYTVMDGIAEFRLMVEALHAAGIEVVLDIVLNHTAETDELGPVLSFRGLDNASWYRLEPEDPRLYVNTTGCGNTVDLSKPHVLRFALDVLRHWAALGVDGFRFDLALTLGRDASGEFRTDHALFQAIAQDPVLAPLKLIAEPWDVHGYRLGGFPPPFAEWNDRFRDTMRRFWRGDEAVLPELARRLLGSSDLIEHSRRSPQASINFVTSHDGAPLKDLVTYSRKHNEANGEDNRDGHHDEAWANYGIEGETSDPAIRELRLRQRRNLMASLLMSQGTPMLLMGDEVGRTQRGNNNAYCQDSPVSWLDWQAIDAEDEAFMAFVARLIELRRMHPALRRRRFLHGRQHDPEGNPDIAWFAADGSHQAVHHWQDRENRCLGMLLGGAAGPDLGARGEPLLDDTLLLLLNAQAEKRAFILPQIKGIEGWRLVLDTNEPLAEERRLEGNAIALEGRSLVLLVGEKA